MMGKLTVAVLWPLLMAITWHCKPVLCTIDDFPWPDAVDLMQSVCPFEQICEIPTLNKGIKTSCCSGCSCEPDCAGRCCFPRNTKSDEETCLFTRSKHMLTYVQSTAQLLTDAYYVVTKSPPGGCVNGSPDGCTVEDGSTMAPVYSQERVKIYFNGACAACHGVREFVEWDSALVCDRLGSPTPVDFERETAKYIRDPSSSTCFLVYYLHGVQGLITRRCLPDAETIFVGTKDVGKGDIEPNFNISFDSILDACKGGFYAPVKANEKWYPNPFCFIYDTREGRSPVCYTTSENMLGLDYMTVLNPSVNGILQSTGAGLRTSVEMVCPKDDPNSQILEPPPCRPISCPFGHVKNPSDGSCVFIGSTVYFKSMTSFSFNILLKRFTDNSKDTDALEDDILTVADIKDALELPSELTVSMVGIPVDSVESETTNWDELLIRLQPVTRNSTAALEMLKVHLSKSIVIDNGSLKRKYTQLLYPLVTYSTDINDLQTSIVHCAVETYGVLKTLDQDSTSSQETTDHTMSDLGGNDRDAVSRPEVGNQADLGGNDRDAVSRPEVGNQADLGGNDRDAVSRPEVGHQAAVSALNTDGQWPGQDNRNKAGLSGQDTEGQDVPPSQDINGQDIWPDQGANGKDATTPVQGSNDRDATPVQGSNGQDATPVQGSNGQDATPGKGFNGQDVTPSQGIKGQDATPGQGSNRQNDTPGQGANGQDVTPSQGIKGQDATPGQGANGQGAMSDLNIDGARFFTTCWKMLFADFRINVHSIVITKMYFCDIVELMPGEFRLLANDSVLFYEVRHVYLYANEFMVLENDNGIKMVKICLEDSGFVRRVSSAAYQAGCFADFAVLLGQGIIIGVMFLFSV